MHTFARYNTYQGSMSIGSIRRSYNSTLRTILHLFLWWLQSHPLVFGAFTVDLITVFFFFSM